MVSFKKNPSPRVCAPSVTILHLLSPSITIDASAGRFSPRTSPLSPPPPCAQRCRKVKMKNAPTMHFCAHSCTLCTRMHLFTRFSTVPRRAVHIPAHGSLCIRLHVADFAFRIGHFEESPAQKFQNGRHSKKTKPWPIGHIGHIAHLWDIFSSYMPDSVAESAKQNR